MRISREMMWMQIAEVASRRSTCFRRNVGAVITLGTSIVSIGYNGPPSGEPHCTGADCVPPGTVGCQRAIHAEINALNRLPMRDRFAKRMFVTESPCLACASRIATREDGVTDVYYLNEYRDPAGIDHLLKSGIRVFRMTPSGYIINRATQELVIDASGPEL